MKNTIEELEERLKAISNQLHSDETGDEDLEDLHAGYKTVIEDLKRDRTEEWINEIDEENYTVRVRFSDSEELFYVATALISFHTGWMSVDKFDNDSESFKHFKEHPMKGLAGFDDKSYYRGIMDFRFWKVKMRSHIEKKLPLTNKMVRDYIYACIGNGWRPKTTDNLREDQNKDIVQLDYMIQKIYGDE